MRSQMLPQMALSLPDGRACQVGQNIAHVTVGCIFERFAFRCFRSRAALTVNFDPEPPMFAPSETLFYFANLAMTESFFDRTDCPVWHGPIPTKKRVVVTVLYQESAFLIAPSCHRSSFPTRDFRRRCRGQCIRLVNFEASRGISRGRLKCLYNCIGHNAPENLERTLGVTRYSLASLPRGALGVEPSTRELRPVTVLASGCLAKGGQGISANHLDVPG